ncbi:MAG: hypothetical protein E7170_04855 [Firmicutes bacterium]|nr:hypothetical protein [Bacillota bacterium]
MGFMNGEVTGIKENTLDSLVIHISDKADDIKRLFNSIDDEFNKIYNNFNCSVSSCFHTIYDEMKENYQIINENILSYSMDYAKVKNSYVEKNIEIVNQIKSFSEDVKVANKYEEGR